MIYPFAQQPVIPAGAKKIGPPKRPEVKGGNVGDRPSALAKCSRNIVPLDDGRRTIMHPQVDLICLALTSAQPAHFQIEPGLLQKRLTI